MKRKTMLSAVTVIAALSLAGQVFAFGGGGGSRGIGGSARSLAHSSTRSLGQNHGTNGNSGLHLGANQGNGKHNGNGLNGTTNRQTSMNGGNASAGTSSQGSKQLTGGTGQKRSSNTTMGSTGRSGGQQRQMNTSTPN